MTGIYLGFLFTNIIFIVKTLLSFLNFTWEENKMGKKHAVSLGNLVKPLKQEKPKEGTAAVSHFGYLLKKVRKALNLTPAKLVEKLTLTDSIKGKDVLAIERGENEPTHTFLKRFSEVFEVPIHVVYWINLKGVLVGFNQKESDKFKRSTCDLMVTLVTL